MSVWETTDWEHLNLLGRNVYWHLLTWWEVILSHFLVDFYRNHQWSRPLLVGLREYKFQALLHWLLFPDLESVLIYTEWRSIVSLRVRQRSESFSIRRHGKENQTLLFKTFFFIPNEMTQISGQNWKCWHSTTKRKQQIKHECPAAGEKLTASEPDVLMKMSLLHTFYQRECL